MTVLSYHLFDIMTAMFRRKYSEKTIICRIRAFFFTAAWILLFTVPVRAYIDPSVMTYAIQAVAGIAISAGMFAGIYWRKIRRALGIGKQESTASILNDQLTFHDPLTGEDRYALEFMAEDERIRLIQEAEQKQKTEYRNSSLRTAVLLGAAISYLWMFYAPLQILFSNFSEFRFDFYTVLPTLCLMFAVGFITALIVYFILYKCSRKLFLAVIAFSVIVLLGTYVQGNFLVKGLQTLDGSEIIWSGHIADHIRSLVLWAALFAIIIFLYRRYTEKQFMSIARGIAAAALTALVITNIASGLANGGFQRKQSAIVTTDREYTMSTDQNFVIFVIDAAAGTPFRSLLETDDPEYKDLLEDFTFFPNTVCAYTYTEQAIPQMMTGRWYEFQKPFEEFTAEAMKDSPLFRTLQERDYRIGVYEEELLYNDDGIFDFENVSVGRYRLANFAEYARSSFCLMWYMYAPYAMKRILANPGLYSTIRNQAQAERDPYLGDNGVFYRNLQASDIETVDDRCFRFIHIDGAHVPFVWDRDVNRIPMKDGSYVQNYQASMTIVNLYLQKLKDAGVFDNTAIIIMADHGYDLEGHGNKGRENPLFLVKGLGENHEFRISEQPVSYEDLMDIYMRLLDGKPAEELIDYAEGEQRDRRIIVFDLAHKENFFEYRQTGYADDEDTMIPTGREYNEAHPGED